VKNEVERRPLLILCLTTIVGIASLAQPLNALFLLPLLFLPGIQPRLVGAAGFALGVLLAPAAVKVQQEKEAGLFEGRVLVVSVPEPYPTGMRAIVRHGAQDFFLYYPDVGISLGDVLLVKGVVKPLSEGSAFLNQRISGRIDPEITLEIVERGSWLARLGLSWRDSYLSFNARALDEPERSVVAALCFNADNDLDPSIRDDLQRTGTTHIISTSGLHVMIFAFGLNGLLSLLPLPRWLQLLILTAVLTLYATATGLHPPVVRSVIMALVYFGAFLVRREPDLITALALAALVYILWRPASIFEIGFQLSFVTVGAMALFLRPRDSVPTQPLKRLAFETTELVKVSLIASFGSIPLVAYHFGVVSVISVVANLAIAVALPPLILVALISYLVSFFAPAIAFGAMSSVVASIAGWLLFVADRLAAVPFAAFEVPAFSGYWLVPIYGAMLLLWRKSARQP
jgi:competence protein ComEC